MWFLCDEAAQDQTDNTNKQTFLHPTTFAFNVFFFFFFVKLIFLELSRWFRSVLGHPVPGISFGVETLDIKKVQKIFLRTYSKLATRVENIRWLTMTRPTMRLVSRSEYRAKCMRLLAHTNNRRGVSRGNLECTYGGLLPDGRIRTGRNRDERNCDLTNCKSHTRNREIFSDLAFPSILKIRMV